MRKMINSGIEWIGEIPHSWRIVPLNYFLDEDPNAIVDGPFGSDMKNEEYVEDGIPVIQLGSIRESGMDFSKMHFVTEEKANQLKRHIALPNDIAIAKMMPAGKACEIPSLYDRYVVSADVIKATVSDSYSRKFLIYALNSCATVQALIESQGSTRSRVNITKVKHFKIPRPDYEEMVRICKYLDNKTAQIDSVITKQEAIINKLKEYSISVITEAVTKGLNPNAPMKNSNIELIGDIPSHWNTGKTLYSLKMPITDGPHETPEFYDDGIPFVSAEAVSCGNGSIDFNHIRGFISFEYYNECCKKYTPQRNDIYMIKSGATTGKVSIVDTDKLFTIWSPLAVFRCDEKVTHYKYLFYFLQSEAYQKQVQDKWTYGTQQNIGMRTLEKLFICYPPVDEQRNIADFLDKKLSSINNEIKLLESIIDKLLELKKSLVYETITGKKEV